MADIYGTSGDDTLIGTDGIDRLYGLEGADALNGGFGADEIYGGAGSDVIRFTSVSISYPSPTQAGLLDGGEGWDSLDVSSIWPYTLGTITNNFGDYTAGIYIGNQKFEIKNIEVLYLGSNDDQTFLPNFSSIKVVDFGSGNDVGSSVGSTSLYMGWGNDSAYVHATYGQSTSAIVSGGEGIDTLRLGDAFSVDVAANVATAGSATYTITGFERFQAAGYAGGSPTTIHGSDANETMFVEAADNRSSGVTFDGRGGDDSLSGSIRDDTLLGGDGNDLLHGGSGNDYLDGGSGSDTLAGGPGNDRIVYDAADNLVELTGGEGNDVLLVNNTSTPFLFDLNFHSFEAAIVTQTDQGGNPWASIEQIYNGNWALLSQTTVNDDYSRVIIDVDHTNSVNTTQIWSAYDSLGRLDSVDQLFDNGTRTFINLDQANTSAVLQDWFTYDAQGRLDSEDVLLDDGSRSFINFDQSDSSNLASEWNVYDPNGALDSWDQFFDDGTRTFINLDQNNSATWSQAWFTYDAAGQLDTQDVLNDNGSRVFYNYDQAGTEAFSLNASYYDSNQVLYQQITVLDDHTTQYLYF
jgi:Ca2+-binding RTX toxin-like protein